MVLGKPVKIPKVPGKILIQKRGNVQYVLMETGRKYDPEKQYNTPERKVIGVLMEDRPDMMLPNENFYASFPDAMNGPEPKEADYGKSRDTQQRIRDYFDQVYFEFMALSRKMPELKINANKARRINQVLRPMMDILQEDDGAELLEFLPEEVAKEEDRMSYSDAGLLLTLWKTAVNRHFMKMR